MRRAGSAALNFRDLGHSVGSSPPRCTTTFRPSRILLNEAAAEDTTAFVDALKDGARTSRSFRQDMLVLADLFVGAQGQELSCLCGMLATEADLLEPAVKTTVNGFFAKLQAWVIEQADARDVAAPGGLPPATFARLLVSLLEGALLLSRLQAHKASLAAARDWIRKAT